MLAAIAASVLALGVGATDANSIVVRINGKATSLSLAGVAGGSQPGTAFAKCLVAGRILQISGPGSAAAATLLDGHSVAALVREFLETTTSSDPCTLGKAAYQPVRMVVNAPSTSPSTSSANPRKRGREVHVSFTSGTMTEEALRVASRPAPSEAARKSYREEPAPSQSGEQPANYRRGTVPVYDPLHPQPSTLPTVGATQTSGAVKIENSLPQRGVQPIDKQGPVQLITSTPPTIPR